MKRVFILRIAVLALMSFAWVGTACAEVYLGKVVSSLEGKLVATSNDGKTKRAFTPDRDTRITLNSTPCKLEELLPGFSVTVKTNDDDGKVESISARGKAEKARDQRPKAQDQRLAVTIVAASQVSSAAPLLSSVCHWLCQCDARRELPTLHLPCAFATSRSRLS